MGLWLQGLNDAANPLINNLAARERAETFIKKLTQHYKSEYYKGAKLGPEYTPGDNKTFFEICSKIISGESSSK